jgi:TolB protein
MAERSDIISMNQSAGSIAVSRHLTRRRLLVLGSGAVALASLQPASASMRIDITGVVDPKPMPIALPDFIAAAPSESDLARSVTGVIHNNLERSGVFELIDPRRFKEQITNIDTVPHFPDWRVINAQALITGRITRQGQDQLKAEFRLWDVFAAKHLEGKQYFVAVDAWRSPAHLISDTMYERLTGAKIFFGSPCSTDDTVQPNGDCDR